jgi:hypothetical protein
MLLVLLLLAREHQVLLILPRSTTVAILLPMLLVLRLLDRQQKAMLVRVQVRVLGLVQVLRRQLLLALLLMRVPVH